jgi:cytochrome c oxidase assembly factor 2
MILAPIPLFYSFLREQPKMPPHLHPRSRLTSSLFATTLFASFFVVALPHALPCPAPRVAYADDGTPHPRRRRRRKCTEEEQAKETLGESSEEDNEGLRRQKRECPVPKPGGIVGDILGFTGLSSTEGKGSKPP